MIDGLLPGIDLGFLRLPNRPIGPMSQAGASRAKVSRVRASRAKVSQRLPELVYDTPSRKMKTSSLVTRRACRTRRYKSITPPEPSPPYARGLRELSRRVESPHVPPTRNWRDAEENGSGVPIVTVVVTGQAWRNFSQTGRGRT